MVQHTEIRDNDLRSKIRSQEICLGGNRKLRIYGLLSCTSGKRMKRENRVFFTSIEDAQQNNYRPCGHCLKEEYQNWKNNRSGRHALNTSG